MSDDLELRMAWDAMMSPTPWRPAGPRSDSGTRRVSEVFDDLVGRHRQAHRHYHGPRHVVWVLRHARHIESAIPACSDPESYDTASVTAAAFFHDAVYDPRRIDNEERSARLADVQLASMGWTPDRRQAVVALVLATAGHVLDHGAGDGGDGGRDFEGSPTRLERAVLLDADLAVLGSEPNAYAGYVNGVRQEYSHLGADEWAAGRTDVLRQLLDRGEQFTTDPARAWWGAAARANMTAEVAALTSSR